MVRSEFSGGEQITELGFRYGPDTLAGVRIIPIQEKSPKRKCAPSEKE
jgi:hypothetical protein